MELLVAGDEYVYSFRSVWTPFPWSVVPSSCSIQVFPGTGSVASWDEYGLRNHIGMISATEATG